jgi:hypothetical protein
MAMPPDFGAGSERGGPDDPGLEQARPSQPRPPARGRRAGYAVVGALLIAIVVVVVLLLVL